MSYAFKSSVSFMKSWLVCKRFVFLGRYWTLRSCYFSCLDFSSPNFIWETSSTIGGLSALNHLHPRTVFINLLCWQATVPFFRFSCWRKISVCLLLISDIAQFEGVVILNWGCFCLHMLEINDLHILCLELAVKFCSNFFATRIWSCTLSQNSVYNALKGGFSCFFNSLKWNLVW